MIKEDIIEGTLFGINKNHTVLCKTSDRKDGRVLYKCKCGVCGNEEWFLKRRDINNGKYSHCGCGIKPKLNKYEVGTIHVDCYGDSFEVIEKVNRSKIKIKYLNDCKNVIRSINSLSAQKPKSYYVKEGDIFHTTKGDKYVVIDASTQSKVKIKFLDEYGYETFTQKPSILNKTVLNPYHKSRFGFYLGSGKYGCTETYKHIHKIWKDIEKRVNNSNQPTYKNVTVCEEWYNFQNFAEFYDKNYPHYIKDVKFEIDKDLLQYDEEFKVYSPETCLWLPSNINIFLTSGKKKNIKNTSSKYLGVSFHKETGKWRALIRDFQTGKSTSLGLYKTEVEAHETYMKARALKVEEVKDYLRSLNYLPEEVIQLVK